MECLPRGIGMVESGDGPSFVPGSATSACPRLPGVLNQIRRRYRGWQVTLLLEGDSSHTANASQTLAAQLGIQILWLSKRAPALNPMDNPSLYLEHS
jgi:hypothetical protein